MTLKTALRSALLATALAGLGSAAMAAGTPLGTSIENSIDITYTTGSSTITQNDVATVSFVVDRKVDFLLEGQDASAIVTVSQDADQQQLTFRLVNEGNDVSGYDIDVASSGAIGLTYDALGSGSEGSYSVYIGATADPVSAADTLYDTTGTVSIGDIAADGEIYVKILANIPASATDGDNDSFTVSATALNAGTSTVTVETASPAIGTVDTFLADPDADGIETDAESYVVSAPVLSATKTSTLVSENLGGAFNCATGGIDALAEAFVPGACVEYTLSVTNDAGASSAASNLALTDILPPEVTFVSVFSNSGFDSVSESASTVTATAANLAIGATAEARIRVTID